MALNPQLFPNGMPVPFVSEMFVLARDGVEFEVDKIPTSGNHGGHLKTKGIIYLSNIRMVFVAKSPVGGITAFDMPLAAQTPVDEMMRHAYVDPNDPTRIFLQQPDSDSQLRRRTYQPQADGGHV